MKIEFEFEPKYPKFVVSLYASFVSGAPVSNFNQVEDRWILQWRLCVDVTLGCFTLLDGDR